MYAMYGDTRRGLELTLRAVEQGDELIRGWRSMPLALAGVVYVYAHKLAEAEAVIQEAQQSIPMGDMQAAVIVALADCELSLARGDTTKINSITDNFISLCRAAGIRAFMTRFLYLSGRAHMQDGQLDEAHVILTEARVEAEEKSARHDLLLILAALIELESARGHQQVVPALRARAREVLEYISAHISDVGLRASFLRLPQLGPILDESLTA
jgi:ATP/maltotriose-dependent transcriptional regulator MalT